MNDGLVSLPMPDRQYCQPETKKGVQMFAKHVIAVAVTALTLSGCGGNTPAPVTSTVTTTIKASDAEQTQLDQQKAALDKRQHDLDTRESAVASQEQLAKMNTITTDGTFLVGQEIQPGTWRNSGNTGCYWARLRNLSGGGDDTIANDNTDGPAVVTIASTDAAFKTERCGTWHKIG